MIVDEGVKTLAFLNKFINLKKKKKKIRLDNNVNQDKFPIYYGYILKQQINILDMCKYYSKNKLKFFFKWEH